MVQLYKGYNPQHLWDWVSLEHTFTCVFTKSQGERCSSTAHILARWEHERTTAR